MFEKWNTDHCRILEGGELHAEHNQVHLWGCGAGCGKRPSEFRKQQRRADQPGRECHMPTCWRGCSSFFTVWQNVLQTKPSKTTILPEGASDGLANNFDQLKWRKTPVQLFTFQNPSTLSGNIKCPFFHPPWPLTKQNPTPGEPSQRGKRGGASRDIFQ